MNECAASSEHPTVKSHCKIHKASLRADGAVMRGAALTEADAVKERKAGRDVVVCGQDKAANKNLARGIEQMANGKYKLCLPHYATGGQGLPHFQPDPRPPDGHCFYETKTRKSKKNP
jgi:hypothetical protein